MKDFEKVVGTVLGRSFPDKSAPPNAWLAFDSYCEFLADAPDRVIELISSDYKDLTEVSMQSQAVDSMFKAQLLEFEGLFKFLNHRFGLPQLTQASAPFLGSEFPGDRDPMKLMSRIDLENFCAFDKFILAGWVHNDRLLIAHLGFVNPDSQVQATVSFSAVPYKN